MIQKNYPDWHVKKALLNSQKSEAYFYEREVWWVAIGHNISDEEDGKGRDFVRPVLIMRKFNASLFYGLPLSTKIKQGRYYHQLSIRGRKNIVLLSHLRDYDAKRLVDKLDVITDKQYAAVQQALMNLLKRPPRPF